MSLSSNIADVAFTTRFPVDKVVRTHTGSFNAPDFVETEHIIDHDLGEAVYSESMFSLDDVTYYPAGMEFTPTFGESMTGAVAVSSTQVKLYVLSNSAIDRTIYYKVFLIWPR